MANFILITVVNKYPKDGGYNTKQYQWLWDITYIKILSLNYDTALQNNKMQKLKRINLFTQVFIKKMQDDVMFFEKLNACFNVTPLTTKNENLFLTFLSFHISWLSTIFYKLWQFELVYSLFN